MRDASSTTSVLGSLQTLLLETAAVLSEYCFGDGDNDDDDEPSSSSEEVEVLSYFLDFLTIDITLSSVPSACFTSGLRQKSVSTSLF